MLYKLKLILAGDAAVGKTALVTRYTTGEMSPEYDATIGVGFAMKLLDIPLHECHDEIARVKLHIWDTAGQETFRCITTAYFRGAAGAIIVYDASSQSGLRDARRWIEDVQKYSPHAKIVLAGNKVDKGDNTLELIDTSSCPAIVGQFKVSAKEGTNVDTIFEECTRNIIKSVINGETDLKNSGIEINGYGVRSAASTNAPPDENVCLIECPSCKRKKNSEASCC